MKTPHAPLEEVASFIKRGITPKYVEDDGICVLNQKCIRDGRVSLEPARLTNKNTRINAEKVLQNGDILVNSTGTGTLGRTAPFFYSNGIEQAVVDTHVTIVRLETGTGNARYLAYVLRQCEPAIVNMAKGATNQVELSARDLCLLPIKLRDKREQDRIASILSAYDDLIENNRRRIQLLEQAARLLYKEWFIQLRFPGHEHVIINDGVPEGWSRVNLNSIIRIEHGYAFKGEYFSEEMSPRILLTPGNFKIGGGIKLDKLKYYSTSGPLDEKNLLKKDDLLITMTDLSKASDTLGYSLLVPELSGKVFLHNQRLGAVYPKENVPFYRHFLDQLFKDFRYRSFVVGSASGTSVKHTSPKKILSYEPVLPSYEKSILIREFDDKVSCMNRQVHNILRTNEKLTLARDLLLPRLMNGEVAV